MWQTAVKHISHDERLATSWSCDLFFPNKYCCSSSVLCVRYCGSCSILCVCEREVAARGKLQLRAAVSCHRLLRVTVGEIVSCQDLTVKTDFYEGSIRFPQILLTSHLRQN